MDVSIRKHSRLAGVEIRHLAALEAVIATGSFGRAGVELGYSQSAISQQIATLERAAGLQLLERPGGRRAVTPTEAGRRLLRHARRASAAMRAAEADLHALAEGEAGTLRVGTFQSAGVRLLPGAMRRYVERWPEVEVRLVEASYDEELLGLLERGELDLAFVLGNDDPAFESLDVLSDPYVLLAPAGSELATSSRPIRPREIAGLPLIGYRRATEGAEAFLRSRGLEPEIVFRSDEGGIVQGLVGAGIGYAVVPLLGVDESRDVAILEVAGVPRRLITIAWHADRTPTPAARAFIEIVTELGAEIAAGYARRVTGPKRTRSARRP
jgi:DNA-binding transcriptional LysR family regulator